jgi:hypothetical protein
MRHVLDVAAIAVLLAAGPALAQSRYSSAGDATSPRAASAAAAGLRLLSWPGKTIRPAEEPAAPDPAPAASTADPLPVHAPEPQPPAPAPNTPPRLVAQASPAAAPAAGARFYSVHRPYGEAPDPITLSPQFMNDATPDLAAPPPPTPRPVTTSSGQVIRALPTDPGTPSSSSPS